MKSPFIVAAVVALMVPALTNAAEIKVLSTQATEEAYRELAAAIREGHRTQNHDRFHWHARCTEAVADPAKPTT